MPGTMPWAMPGTMPGLLFDLGFCSLALLLLFFQKSSRRANKQKRKVTVKNKAVHSPYIARTYPVHKTKGGQTLF